MRRFITRLTTGTIFLAGVTFGLTVVAQPVSAHIGQSCPTIGTYHPNVAGVTASLDTPKGQVCEGTTLTLHATVTSPSQLSLVSYQWPGNNQSDATAEVVYDTQTAGTGTFTVNVPDCFFQVDLVIGLPITQFGAVGPNGYYLGDHQTPKSTTNRLVASAVGGDQPCVTKSTPTPTPTPTATPIPTATPTPTPTATPIPTAPPTPTPTATPRTVVLGITPSPTPTVFKSAAAPRPDTGAGNIMPPTWLIGFLVIQLGALVTWLATRRLQHREVI